MIKKILSFVLILLFIPCVAITAEPAPCYNTYYQTKDAKCLNKLLQNIRDSESAQKPFNPQFPIGFMAEIFKGPKKNWPKLLALEPSKRVKSIYIAALYRAGLTDEAQKFANDIGTQDILKMYQDNNVPTLDSVKITTNPADNDMMIGAYMASGNPERINTILDNFKTADDGMVSNAVRIALMQGKFGPTLAPKGRPSVMARAACEKYQCKTNKQAIMRMMTLSSAFWALGSLSQQDAGIKKTFNDFFNGNEHLKQLVMTEQNAFANYMTALIAYAGIKDNQNINSALSSYEKLGSAKDLQDKWTKKNTQ